MIVNLENEKKKTNNTTYNGEVAQTHEVQRFGGARVAEYVGAVAAAGVAVASRRGQSEIVVGTEILDADDLQKAADQRVDA